MPAMIAASSFVRERRRAQISCSCFALRGEFSVFCTILYHFYSGHLPTSSACNASYANRGGQKRVVHKEERKRPQKSALVRGRKRPLSARRFFSHRAAPLDFDQ